MALVHLLVALLTVGGRRLRRVRHLASDPEVERSCGVQLLPSERALTGWLSRCWAAVRAVLLALRMRFAGHARPLTTAIYTHVSDEDLRRAVRDLRG